MKSLAILLTAVLALTNAGAVSGQKSRVDSVAVPGWYIAALEDSASKYEALKDLVTASARLSFNQKALIAAEDAGRKLSEELCASEKAVLRHRIDILEDRERRRKWWSKVKNTAWPASLLATVILTLKLTK